MMKLKYFMLSALLLMAFTKINAQEMKKEIP